MAKTSIDVADPFKAIPRLCGVVDETSYLIKCDEQRRTMATEEINADIAKEYQIVEGEQRKKMVVLIFEKNILLLDEKDGHCQQHKYSDEIYF